MSSDLMVPIVKPILLKEVLEKSKEVFQRILLFSQPSCDLSAESLTAGKRGHLNLENIVSTDQLILISLLPTEDTVGLQIIDFPDDPLLCHLTLASIGFSGNSPLAFALVASIAIALSFLQNTCILDDGQVWVKKPRDMQSNSSRTSKEQMWIKDTSCLDEWHNLIHFPEEFEKLISLKFPSLYMQDAATYLYANMPIVV